MKFTLLKYLIVYCVTMVILLYDCRAIGDELDDKIYSSLGGYYQDASLVTWVNESNIEEVRNRLNLRKKEDPLPAIAALISIGDEHEVSLAIEQLSNGDSRSPILYSANERSLSKILIGILSSSADDYGRNTSLNSDVMRSSIKTQFVLLFLQIVERGNQFPQETREWASHMQGNMSYVDPEPAVEQIKQWWKLNEKAVTSGRYSEVVQMNQKEAPVSPKNESSNHEPDSTLSSREVKRPDMKAHPKDAAAESSSLSVGKIVAFSSVIIAALISLILYKRKKYSH